MNGFQFLVLKGRYILAQGNPGKTGSRPGLENGIKNRPRAKVDQREFLHSDEMDHFFFAGQNAVQFRPKIMIYFSHRILADGFSTSVPFTQGGVSDRSSRTFALGYDILAFQAAEMQTNKCEYITNL